MRTVNESQKKNFIIIEENLLWSHQTLRKTVMVTSNIEKNGYGHIKHREELVGLHETLRKSVMVTSNIEKICYGHIKHFEKNCCGHIKY